MTEKTMTFAEALNTKPSGRNKHEIYEGIVERIKEKYGGNISDVEAHEAARNLIGFTEVALEVNKQQNTQ